MSQSTNSNYLTAVFFGSTAFVFLNFGLPLRADDLGITAFGIGGMYAVFTGTMLLVRPIVGYCLDHYGRRWFFTFAFLFYTASMFVMAYSSGIVDFYLARFLQGIGASLMWVSARTIVVDLNQSQSRGMAMGKLTTTSVRGSMVGAMYGFTFLGFMPMQEAWVLAFLGYSIMAFVALTWSIFKIQETAPKQAASSELLSRPKLEWTPELRKILFVVFLSAFASALIEPIYLLFLKNKFDLNVVTLALAFLPSGLVYAILPKYSGQWSDKWGRAPVIAFGVAFAGIVSISLPFFSSIVFVAMAYIFFSVGWAMASPAEDALVADMAPETLRGTIIGAKEAAAGIGAACGPLVGGFVYDNWAHHVVFVLNGALLMLAALLAYWWFAGFQVSKSNLE